VIDFRYHLVSLIAVFLAVALGIVIGTTQLNGPLTDNLQAQVTDLQSDKRALEDRTQVLQDQLDDVGGFEEAVGPTLVADSLAGRSVVLVVVDSEDVTTEVVEGMTALLASAGATVTGTLRLTDDYGTAAVEDSLRSYVTGPGRPVDTTLPETDDTGEIVASLLAQVLMVPGEGSPTAGQVPASTSTSSLLAGLTELDVLSQDTASVSPADHAVLLSAGPVDEDEDSDRLAALIQLAAALDAGGSGAVVAGDPDGTGEGGLVLAVRADEAVSAAVSTVDNVTVAAGQISTVLALAAEGRGVTGAYGVGEDTQPVPPLAP